MPSGDSTDRFESSRPDPWLAILDDLPDQDEAIRKIVVLGSQERTARHRFKEAIKTENAAFKSRVSVVEEYIASADKRYTGLCDKIDGLSNHMNQLVIALSGDEHGNEGVVGRQKKQDLQIETLQKQVVSQNSAILKMQNNALIEVIKILIPAAIVGAVVIAYSYLGNEKDAEKVLVPVHVEDNQ